MYSAGVPRTWARPAESRVPASFVSWMQAARGSLMHPLAMAAPAGSGWVDLPTVASLPVSGLFWLGPDSGRLCAGLTR